MTVYYDYTAGRGNYDKGFENEYFPPFKEPTLKFNEETKQYKQTNNKFHYSYKKSQEIKNENKEADSTDYMKQQNYNNQQKQFQYKFQNSNKYRYKGNANYYNQKNRHQPYFIIGSKYQSPPN